MKREHNLKKIIFVNFSAIAGILSMMLLVSCGGSGSSSSSGGGSDAYGTTVQGVVSQFNYLLEKSALEVDEEGRFRSVSEKFPGAIRDLLNEMVMLQALGDYEGTAAFLDRYGRASATLLEAFGRLADVPVDIRPRYPSAEQLLADAVGN